MKALDENRDVAFFARRLTRIACDMDLALDDDSLRRLAPDTDALDAIYDEAGFGTTLSSQARRLADQFPATAE